MRGQTGGQLPLLLTEVRHFLDKYSLPAPRGDQQYYMPSSGEGRHRHAHSFTTVTFCARLGKALSVAGSLRKIDAGQRRRHWDRKT